jgi:hypothetical protein
MEFLVDKVGQGQVSLRVVQFSLAVSFYQCSMFIFHSSKIDAVYSYHLTALLNKTLPSLRKII